jgi:hypothetical protein
MLEGFGPYLIESVLAQVLQAVSGISIFGIDPFAGLATWATNLQDSANTALETAEGAQSTATTASTTSTNIISTVISAFGGSGSGLSGLASSLLAIPQTVVSGLSGIFGFANIGSALEGLAGGILSGFGGGGSGVAAVSNAATAVTNTATSAVTVAQGATTALAQRAVTKTFSDAGDPTGDAVFSFMSLMGTVPTYVAVTPGTPVIGYITTPDAGIKESIYWYAKDGVTTGLTGIYLTVYEVNTATGVCTGMYTTPNILSAVTGITGFVYSNLPTADFFTSAQGNWYAVEMEVTGAPGATYSVVGMPNHWAAASPVPVFPQSMGGTRTQPPLTASYDATGAGGDKNTQTTSTVTETELHTAAAGAYVTTFVQALTNDFGGVAGVTATYGGDAMTALGNVALGAGYGSLYVFGFVVPSAMGGVAETVSATATANSGDVNAVVLNSVSYDNIAAASTVTSVTGDSASVSVGATVVTDGIAVCGIGFVGPAIAVSASAFKANGTAETPRYLHNVTTTTATDTGLLIGDAPNVGAFDFTATLSGTAQWGAITVVLEPAYSPTVPATVTPVYSNNVPGFGLSGSAGPAQHAPATTPYAAHGTYTYTVPDWMVSGDFFDIVIVAAAGGGQAGGLSFGSFGDGGPAGTWFAITLQYGVDAPLSTTEFTIVVGEGGPGGTAGGGGSAGATTTVTITGYSGNPITVAGAAGGTGLGGDNAGGSPGTEMFGVNPLPYNGGAVQTTSGAAGNTPGGAGAGGGLGQNGGAGADAGVWVTAYQ